MNTFPALWKPEYGWFKEVGVVEDSDQSIFLKPEVFEARKQNASRFPYNYLEIEKAKTDDKV
jgi:hypothetical protein